MSITRQKPWQQVLSDVVSDPEQLIEALQLTDHDAVSIRRACQGFPLRVPKPFLSRMQQGDPRDPLLLQVLPQAMELQQVPGYIADPLAEVQSNPVPGLLHKYASRVLLTLVGACAVNCRYCFRRHFPYQDNLPSKAHMDQIIDYLEKDKNINEVIFSGGDPLVLKDKQLAEFVARLGGIAHLKVLRIHTRLPIVIPERVTDEMIAWLSIGRLKSVVVLHSNHAQEIDESVEWVCKRMRRAGVTVLNQSVLLKGINDDAQMLAELSWRLFQSDVLPYYLHILDKVAGAAHFDLPLVSAKKIYTELQGLLPGYLVPKLVVETVNDNSKLLVS